MHYATEYCLEETFATCIKLGARLDIADNSDYLPLHFACRYGTFDMVQTIIEKEPQQVNAKNYDGWTPLHHCAGLGSNKQVIEKAELLVKRGANVN